MKTSIDTLKTWFQTGDKPTEQQFANLIDSFHHKDSGDLITSYTVAANGDLSLTFSDGQTVTAEKFVLPNTMPLTFIDGLVAALNGKVDKVTGKQLTTNDFTTALKNKLNALTQYVHPNAHAISFITGLQDALDTKVDKVDGKALSDENYTAAEKQKLAGLQNYTHPPTHPISEVAGLQAELDQIDQDLGEKVDKVDGKALSDENYTDAEKQKLAGLEQIWSANGNGIISPLDQNTSTQVKKLIIGDAPTSATDSTVYQNVTEDPTIGGELINTSYSVERTANPTGTGYYYGAHKTITRSGTDDETGTKGQQLNVRKTGDFNSLVLYGRDLEVELIGGGTTSFLIGDTVDVRAIGTETQTINGVARVSNRTLLADNPNVTGYFQTMHPVLDLRQGNITGGEVIYMDFDISGHSSPNLNVIGDLTYLAGGSGGDVNAIAAKLLAINKKFRFIHNTGILESDFGGIINFTGDVQKIIDATKKVLINKEYLESLNYTNGIITGNADAPNISNGAHVESLTTRQIVAYDEELEFTNIPSQNAVALRIAPNFRNIVASKIEGTGTVNYLQKATAAGTIGDSQVFDDGTNVGIGTVSPTSRLHVDGLPIHANNAAALSANLTAGAFYHNGDGIVRVVF